MKRPVRPKSRPITVFPLVSPPKRPTLPAMEVDIRISLSYVVEIDIVRHARDVEFILQIKGIKAEEKYGFLNIYDLREVFLDIKTPNEALDFLLLTGCFRFTEVPWLNSRVSMLWSDFRLWQELIRIRLQSGPFPYRSILKDGRDVGCELDVPKQMRCLIQSMSMTELQWLNGVPEGIAIKPLPETRSSDWKSRLIAVIYTKSTLEAILATIYIDELHSPSFHRCPQCAKIFKEKTKHKREYCSQKCAQIAGVRRRREAAKSRSAP